LLPHQNEACCIDKAERLISVTVEELVRLLFHTLSHKQSFQSGTLLYLRQKSLRLSMAFRHPQQRVGFPNNQIDVTSERHAANKAGSVWRATS
jgi:hypothetical protein